MKISKMQFPENFLRNIDIHELLPQKEPFVMISRLVIFDDVRTVTETDIKNDNIFVENGYFTSSNDIESCKVIVPSTSIST